MKYLKKFNESENYEIIQKIEEIDEYSEEYYSVGGYAITTNKQVIKLLMNNDQSCCEVFGYFMSDDDFKDFIGARLIGISIVDTALTTRDVIFMDNEYKYDELKELSDNDDDGELSTIFVNIETSECLLQFVAYNSHNGYYGHKVIIISDQLKEETYL